MKTILGATSNAKVTSLMPLVFARRSEPKPTKVYETYWKFAAERQSIYHRRIQQNQGPWTTDSILETYKFTNPYRAADRTSQFLIQNVIYADKFEWRDTFLRILLFKIFNKIETWELLEHDFGVISCRTFDVNLFASTLSAAMNAGASIYSAAYIMPSGPKSIREGRKHEMHLKLIDFVMKSDFPEQVLESGSMAELFAQLHSLPSFGPFLSYQLATDLNYSDYLSFDEMEFVVPGPGARDGIRKCFASLGDYREADVIRWVTDRQCTEFDSRGLGFESLWGRQLQLIDCQNLFCEVDKYARVAHPNIAGRTKRTRIKQRYTPSREQLPVPWFPPKWSLNDRVAESFSQLPDRSFDRPTTEFLRLA